MVLGILQMATAEFPELRGHGERSVPNPWLQMVSSLESFRWQPMWNELPDTPLTSNAELSFGFICELILQFKGMVSQDF